MAVNASYPMVDPLALAGYGPVIPVIVIERAEWAVPMARALVEGGVRVLEVTLRTEAALAAIEAIARAVPDAVVGAGTIRSAADVLAAQSAGARFAVSPGCTEAVAAACREAALALLPGVATASEVMRAAELGFRFLKFFPAGAAGGPALDAVTAAVMVLEDDPLFNAGCGAVFTRAGVQEMDAAVMDGATLRAGAVAGIRGPRNPVLAARAVMEHSPHMLMAGEGALDLLDDAAVLAPPPGRELVFTTDAMVAGVHFLPDDPADTVGAKLLRVNLSDLAAMAATPWAYLLTVSAPRGTPDAWFRGFAAGLARDQARFGIRLLGGDTTSTPGPVSLTLTCIGHVAPGCALRRRGAAVGDEVWVTGTIGDGALGLAALRGQVADPAGWLAGRYRVPTPRLGLALHGVASAGMDVSDGLVQDLGHLCSLAGLGARIEAARVPLSPDAAAAGPDWLATCLTGGDDYELLLAVPDGAVPDGAVGDGPVPFTRIGRFIEGSGVQVLNGPDLKGGGWSHF